MYKGEREAEMKQDLYNAVALGDIDKAQDAMNLMMMAGIDDMAIMAANKASRPPIPRHDVTPFPLPQGPVGTYMDGLRRNMPKRRNLRRG